MINEKLKGSALVGRKCRPKTELVNAVGQIISPETVCTIVRAGTGHGITIRTEKCPCCKQSFMIRGLLKSQLVLIEEG